MLAAGMSGPCGSQAVGVMEQHVLWGVSCTQVLRGSQHMTAACMHVFLLSLLFLQSGDDNKELWRAHDACELVKGYQGPPLPTLIDTGSADNFLEVQVCMHG